MTGYHWVYDWCHLQHDCQETLSAPCPTLVIKYGTTTTSQLTKSCCSIAHEQHAIFGLLNKHIVLICHNCVFCIHYNELVSNTHLSYTSFITTLCVCNFREKLWHYLILSNSKILIHWLEAINNGISLTGAARQSLCSDLSIYVCLSAENAQRPLQNTGQPAACDNSYFWQSRELSIGRGHLQLLQAKCAPIIVCGLQWFSLRKADI